MLTLDVFISQRLKRKWEDYQIREISVKKYKTPHNAKK